MTNEPGALRQPFSAGALAWPAVKDAVNWGRAHGLDVEVHVSGWLIKRGWIVARGDDATLLELRGIFGRLDQQLSQN